MSKVIEKAIYKQRKEYLANYYKNHKEDISRKAHERYEAKKEQAKKQKDLEREGIKTQKNKIPRGGKTMTITANIDINNLPEIRESGYEVVINDLGSLWHYGFFTNKDRAIEAVEESDNRFMVEINN